MKQKGSADTPLNKMVKGIGASLIVTALMTLVGVGTTAYLIHKELISQSCNEIAATMIYLLSGAAGAFISMNSVKRWAIQAAALSCAAYFLLLLSVTALFFGGEYSQVTPALLAILGGCSVALGVKFLCGKNRKKYKIKTGYR